MINSRDIDELNPQTQALCRAFLSAAEAAGYRVLITSTFRDAESQTALYAQGRTKPGGKVTNAKAGQSWHNFRCAFDFCPLTEGGAADWNNSQAFSALGSIGQSVGLEWGGAWVSFKDTPHLQYTGGRSLGQLQALYGTEAPRSW